MKLSNLHKKIFIIALENEYKPDDFTFVDLLIKAKKIKGQYNRKYSIEYYIGQLIEWKYLKFVTSYDDINEHEIVVVGCNEKKYKIKCELKIKK